MDNDNRVLESRGAVVDGRRRNLRSRFFDRLLRWSIAMFIVGGVVVAVESRGTISWGAVTGVAALWGTVVALLVLRFALRYRRAA